MGYDCALKSSNYYRVFRALLQCLYFYRFCEGNFVSEMETTIGVDFYLSEIDVDGKKIKVS